MRSYRATPIDKPIDSGEFVEGWYSEGWSKASGYSDIGSYIRWLDKEKCYHEVQVHKSTVGQQVGLTDKNGLTEVYEGDIIGVDGLIKGNRHESPNLLQEKTNFVVPAITSKAWEKAYKKAMVRGCKHTK